MTSRSRRSGNSKGRALKVLSTGGLPLACTSVEEKDANGQVIGHRIVIDEAGRAIVEMYLAGKSYDAIAYPLNAGSERDTSPTVRSTLRDLEAQAASENAPIDSIVEAARAPVALLPHPHDLVRREFELESMLNDDPNRGRELLANLFEGGAIDCTPNDHGVYVARSRFFPLALLGLDLGNTKPRSPVSVAGSLVPSRGSEPSCSSHRCAGRI